MEFDCVFKHGPIFFMKKKFINHHGLETIDDLLTTFPFKEV